MGISWRMAMVKKVLRVAILLKPYPILSKSITKKKKRNSDEYDERSDNQQKKQESQREQYSEKQDVLLETNKHINDIMNKRKEYWCIKVL